LDIIKKDIENGFGFVLVYGKNIISYCAIMINDEPEYTKIKGEWLSNEGFVVFHRLAVSKNYLGKGIATRTIKHIEQYTLDNKIYSVKADTNFDNFAMNKIFENLGYIYCGEVYFRGSPRKAFEKILE
jgi:GNAT superfamily N-acetyltransferase